MSHSMDLRSNEDKTVFDRAIINKLHELCENMTNLPYATTFLYSNGFLDSNEFDEFMEAPDSYNKNCKLFRLVVRKRIPWELLQKTLNKSGNGHLANDLQTKYIELQNSPVDPSENPAGPPGVAPSIAENPKRRTQSERTYSFRSSQPNSFQMSVDDFSLPSFAEDQKEQIFQLIKSTTAGLASVLKNHSCTTIFPASLMNNFENESVHLLKTRLLAAGCGDEMISQCCQNLRAELEAELRQIDIDHETEKQIEKAIYQAQKNQQQEMQTWILDNPFHLPADLLQQFPVEQRYGKILADLPFQLSSLNEQQQQKLEKDIEALGVQIADFTTEHREKLLESVTSLQKGIFKVLKKKLLNSSNTVETLENSLPDVHLQMEVLWDKGWAAFVNKWKVKGLEDLQHQVDGYFETLKEEEASKLVDESSRSKIEQAIQEGFGLQDENPVQGLLDSSKSVSEFELENYFEDVRTSAFQILKSKVADIPEGHSKILKLFHYKIQKQFTTLRALNQKYLQSGIEIGHPLQDLEDYATTPSSLNRANSEISSTPSDHVDHTPRARTNPITNHPYIGLHHQYHHRIKNQQSFGIDFGTTMCVSIFRPKKDPETIGNGEEKLIPNYVSFPPKGEPIVGSKARNQAAVHKSSTIFNYRHLIGRQFQELKPENIASFPLKLEKDATSGRVNISLPMKKCTPEEVATVALEHLKQMIWTHQKRQISKPRVAITVPSDFETSQIDALRKAAEDAGFKVLELIPEPIAAVLAYKIKPSEEDRHVIVFHFSAASLIVTVIHVLAISSLDATEKGHKRSHFFKIRSASTDETVGGNKVDENLVNFVLNDLAKTHPPVAKLFGHKLKENSSQSHKANLIKDKLKKDVEKFKIALSDDSSLTKEIFLPTFHDDPHDPYFINREVFQKANSTVYSQCTDVIDQALEQAKIAKDLVDDIIFVGGASNDPMVKKTLEQYFLGQHITFHHRIGRNEVIASGAAIFAHEF